MEETRRIIRENAEIERKLAESKQVLPEDVEKENETPVKPEPRIGGTFEGTDVVHCSLCYLSTIPSSKSANVFLYLEMCSCLSVTVKLII